MSKLSPKELIKKNPFVLAPMDDVTDIAFRELAEELGASYSTTELTSVDALVRDKVPKARYERGKLKHNSVQLFGSKPDVFVEAAKKVGDEADAIDINLGCPSACVNSNEAGAILLKDPKNVGKIVEKLVKHIDKPITAKIRLGYKKTTYLEVAKEVEDAGAHLLAVHGRTQAQRYSGFANWDAIKEVHEHVDIPVIGNGDVKTEDDIDEKLGSRCDALMIGRAAIGNPMIFKQFSEYYKTGKKLEFDKKTVQKELFVKYLEKLSHYDVFRVERRIQRQAMWFMKGIEGVKDLRRELQQVKDVEKVKELVRKF